jgi:hypothetical protein
MHESKEEQHREDMGGNIAKVVQHARSDATVGVAPEPSALNAT